MSEELSKITKNPATSTQPQTQKTKLQSRIFRYVLRQSALDIYDVMYCSATKPNHITTSHLIFYLKWLNMNKQHYSIYMRIRETERVHNASVSRCFYTFFFSSFNSKNVLKEWRFYFSLLVISWLLIMRE